jgi:peptide alpha-N-acetyltransferase
MTILRDASTLQTQLRLFDSLEQTRLTILKLKPSIRQNWVSLAVAYALNNNWQACQKLLEEFLSMIKVCAQFLANVRMCTHLTKGDSCA